MTASDGGRRKAKVTPCSDVVASSACARGRGARASSLSCSVSSARCARTSAGFTGGERTNAGDTSPSPSPPAGGSGGGGGGSGGGAGGASTSPSPSPREGCRPDIEGGVSVSRDRIARCKSERAPDPARQSWTPRTVLPCRCIACGEDAVAWRQAMRAPPAAAEADSVRREVDAQGITDGEAAHGTT